MTEEEIPTKRICEDPNHPEIELEPFQECPHCGSESYHKSVPL